jgi:hypothetical protein
MTATFTELLPPTKSEKHGALTWEPATDNDTSPVAGALTITGKRCHCRYRVEGFPADHGRGFMLFKIDAGTDRTEERYACLVGSHGTNLCECRGFLATGSCKHLAALLALVGAGRV